ncbi:hypothetical protein [Bacteroides acidifaciens]|uniref:hypothetical protein n=1 Tax=Bacteroides acidifaciens TaxID=85831 RepID=UPI003F690099
MPLAILRKRLCRNGKDKVYLYKSGKAEPVEVTNGHPHRIRSASDKGFTGKILIITSGNIAAPHPDLP